MSETLRVLWLYPNSLHLHGDRGNLMALERVGQMLGLETSVCRVDSFSHPIDFDFGDLMILNAGEVRVMPYVVAALQRQQAGLRRFLDRGGMLLAMANAGSVLGQKTLRQNGTEFAGLGLLDYTCRERESVYGDDLWFTLPSGEEVVGCQIRLLDVELQPGQSPLGQVIYGYGNCRQADEGARRGNVIFTNALGPALVKNPRFTASLIKDALAPRGVELPDLTPEQTRLEDQSYDLITKFIRNKMKDK